MAPSDISGKTVWVLLGHRLGDNRQALAIADGLGASCETRRMHYTRGCLVPNVLLRSGLASLDRAASDNLAPPWPDLVIGTGRRHVPVARWIQRRSGGRTKIVQVGRPRAPLSWFDLVITTPQYGLPREANVLELPLPVVPPRAAAPDEAHWASIFAPCPRPHIGVLVGGAAFPYRFDETDASRLMAAATAEVRPLGGSLLVATSPRTPKTVCHRIAREAGPRDHVHVWSPRSPNPYPAILATADRFIVTSESVSMIADAVSTGRPVQLFRQKRHPALPRWNPDHPVVRSLVRYGLVTPPRHVSTVHERLVDMGLVGWLGGSPPVRNHAETARETAVSAVRALLATGKPPESPACPAAALECGHPGAHPRLDPSPETTAA